MSRSSAARRERRGGRAEAEVTQLQGAGFAYAQAFRGYFKAIRALPRPVGASAIDETAFAMEVRAFERDLVSIHEALDATVLAYTNLGRN